MGAYLTSLRLNAGLDVAVLARRVSLSAAQVAELENGRASLFYNPSIRRQAARKIILHLAGDLSQLPVDSPAAPPLAVPDTAPAPAVEAMPPPIGLRPAEFQAPSAPAAQSASVFHTPDRPARNWAARLALLTLLVGLGFGAARWSASRVQPVQALAAPASPSAVVVQPESATLSPPPVEAKPLEMAVAALPDAPASALEALSAKADRLTTPCAWQPGDVPVFQPAQARKPGDMVYIVSLVSQVLCVADASGKPQVQRLEAGQAQSFYGQPPWQVASNQLQQTQLFFQGSKVRLPEHAQDRIQLVELR